MRDARPRVAEVASDPRMELRVSRLENDRDSIYDLLAEFRSTQQEHSQRFDNVDQRFDKVDQRFDKVDQRLGEIDQRLGELDQRLGEINQRFEKVDITLTEVVRRLPMPS